MSKPFIDFEKLKGKKFNLLTIVSEEPFKSRPSGNLRVVKCLCDCGKFIIVLYCELKSGRKKSCGCANEQPGTNIQELIGKKIGRLTIIGESERHISTNGKSLRVAICKCDCGKTKHILLNILTCSRPTQSCGCMSIECSKSKNKKHGLINHTLYRKWFGMKTRCYNEKYEGYARYGGRGIKVCDEWLNDFMSFYNWSTANGWRKGLEIDRENGDGNYEPSNCRFITQKENNRNKSVVKLSLNAALDIRKIKASNPKITNKKIAEDFKISQSTVAEVLRNEIWV